MKLKKSQKQVLSSFLLNLLFCFITAMISSVGFLSLAEANLPISTVFRFAADDWCPFTCTSPLSEKPGIVTEVVHQSLKQAGLEMKYDVISWARAIKMAETNKIHGVLGAYRSDLPEFLFSEKPIITSRDCFFVKTSDQWNYKDLESIRSRKVGIIKDYGYGEVIDAEKVRGAQKYFFEVSGDEPLKQNLKKLEAGRIDTILENEMVIKYIKRKDGFKTLRAAGCLPDKAIYAALNPTDPENKKAIAAIDQFLKSRPQDLKAIIQKYTNE